MNQPTSGARFQSTCWTVVRQAGDDARDALSTLCDRYWPPLYGWLRRSGHDPDDAHDLLQGFLGDLIDRGDLQAADPEKGRFRGWLLTCLRNWEAKEHRREEAAKRGGSVRVVSLDRDRAEAGHSRLEPADRSLDPEALYHRRWALGIIESALDTLREEQVRRGRGALFDAIAGRLTGAEAEDGLAEVATRHDVGEEAVKSLLHRSRRRFRRLVVEAVRETLNEEDDVETELRSLFEALR